MKILFFLNKIKKINFFIYFFILIFSTYYSFSSDNGFSFLKKLFLKNQEEDKIRKIKLEVTRSLQSNDQLKSDISNKEKIENLGQSNDLFYKRLLMFSKKDQEEILKNIKKLSEISLDSDSRNELFNLLESLIEIDCNT